MAGRLRTLLPGKFIGGNGDTPHAAEPAIKPGKPTTSPVPGTSQTVHAKETSPVRGWGRTGRGTREGGTQEKEEQEEEARAVQPCITTKQQRNRKQEEETAKKPEKRPARPNSDTHTRIINKATLGPADRKPANLTLLCSSFSQSNNANTLST